MVEVIVTADNVAAVSGMVDFIGLADSVREDVEWVLIAQSLRNMAARNDDGWISSSMLVPAHIGRVMVAGGAEFA